MNTIVLSRLRKIPFFLLTSIPYLHEYTQLKIGVGKSATEKKMNSILKDYDIILENRA
jgi:hypothetical protein